MHQPMGNIRMRMNAPMNGQHLDNENECTNKGATLRMENEIVVSWGSDGVVSSPEREQETKDQTQHH